MEEISAVIDIGTARVKATLASSVDGHIIFENLKRDIFSEGSWSDVEFALEQLTSLKDEIVRKKCTKVVVIGTEVFRRRPNFRSITDEITQIFGGFDIVTPSLEAALFLSSVQHSAQLKGNVVAVDIGGGSIQVVWSSETGESLSLPIGTFKLEELFQDSPTERDVLSSSTLHEMSQYVTTSIKDNLPANLDADVLIVGSNIMEDFFTAAMDNIGLRAKTSNTTLHYSKEQVRTLAERVSGVRYSDLHEYFPENPRFMFGADKLLLIVMVLLDSLKSQYILPTNESVSKGLSRMLLERPEMLEQYGLNIVLSS